jgi:UTP--glucose-1-phosphate uridylyltransferase
LFVVNLGALPMATSIDEQLRQLPKSVQHLLQRFGFDPERFADHAEKLRSGHEFDNRLHGLIEPPRSGDVVPLPPADSAAYRELEALGTEELAQGRCALVVLAGGMATRMGGVVKALVEALPGKTFLDLRLASQKYEERRYGRAVPLWLMTSHATDAPTRAALGSALDGDRVAVFTQFLSLRMTPEGGLFLDENGEPSLHSPGHGDLPDALRKSGLLARFVERGGRTVMVTNLDNLGGTIEPALVGFHIQHGLPLTSETVDKLESDRGGVPVRVGGKLRVLEEFRIPENFDPATVRVFNTNVFQFDARALLDLDMEWTYYKVEKSVAGAKVIQFERILNEVTAELATRYLHAPRSGARARFLPCKDMEELERRRPEIELVARTRGML